MAEINDAQSTQGIWKLLKKADSAVAGLPELQSLWNDVRQTVLEQIKEVPPSKFATTKWPPLFVWLRTNLSDANMVEEALTAVKRSARQEEFKQASRQLTGRTEPEQAYPRIVELVMAGRCLDRSLPGTVRLHPRVSAQGRRRADMAVMLDNRRVYVEITVLCERRSASPGGPRSGMRELYSCRDGARILGKILEKVAPGLDPCASQLSPTDPNALLLSLAPSTEEAYLYAMQWALAALDQFPGRIHEAVAKRNARRKVPLSDAEVGQITDAFLKISCVLAFRGFMFWRPWRRRSGPLSLTGGEVRRLIALFR